MSGWITDRWMDEWMDEEWMYISINDGLVGGWMGTWVDG